MIGNKIAALALLSAVADQTLAAPGHQHRQLHAVEKRALTVEVVTEIVTVTVTYGAEPSTLTSTSTVNKGGIFVPAPSSSSAAAPQVENQDNNKAIVSSSSSSVVQDNVQVKPTTTSTSAAAPTTTAQPTTVEPTTTAQPTTTAAPSSSSTTSSAAATTSASSGGGSGAGKRGIGYNDGTLGNKVLSSCSKCSWAYNWETSDKGGPASIYIPTLKENEEYWTSLFASEAAGSVSKSSKGLAFSLNEPDLKGVSVAAAVAAHEAYMPKSNAAKYVAPSVTNGQGSALGLSYLQDWVTACKASTTGCKFDYCNLHWYDYMAATDTLYSNIQKAYDICGKNIYITEFAPKDGTVAEVAAWLGEVLPKLDSMSIVEGYSYFMSGNAQTEVQWNLFDASGSLNAIGQAYVTL